MSASGDLLLKRGGCASIGTELHVVSESAATPALATIPVGAGEVGIDGYFVHALAITMQHRLTKRIHIVGKCHVPEFSCFFLASSMNSCIDYPGHFSVLPGRQTIRMSLVFGVVY